MPPSKADCLLEAAEHIVAELRNLASLVGSVGRSSIGSQYLLVHWAAREGALGVSEDELDAELQQVAGEAWAQVLDELRQTPEIDLQTPAGKAGSEDSR